MAGSVWQISFFVTENGKDHSEFLDLCFPLEDQVLCSFLKMKCQKTNEQDFVPIIGTALEALSSMQSFLRSRPKHFSSLEQGIEWR